MLLAFKSNGQGKALVFNNQQSVMFGEYKFGNDTLYIYPQDKIHFLKIGDRVYKIESPTLTEVKPIGNKLGYSLQDFISTQPNTLLPYFQRPLYNTLIDTSVIIKK